MASFRIISTLGPKSLDSAFLDTCVRVGQPSIRLNGSHLSESELVQALELVARVPRAFAITLDLQGDKRRIGELTTPLTLVAGKSVTVRLVDAARLGEVPLPHPEIFTAAKPGDRLALMDGQIWLRLDEVLPDSSLTTVEKGGVLRSKAGVHLEGLALAAHGLPAAQVRQLEVAKAHSVTAIALSYVRGAADVQTLRQHCASLDYHPRLVAKVERPEAVLDVEAICRGADEIWLCRGDLGALGPLRELGAWQARAIRAAIGAGIPCLVAGQVFHHLTDHPEPTRTEVVHLHDTREAGAAGIVLSDETAIGRDPSASLIAIAALL
jgi:pyruvate kinase